MKRSSLIATFVLFIVLCISAAYWAMQLFKAPVRPAAAPPQSKAEVPIDAAAGLFGGSMSGTVVASNYELRGVVVSGTAKDSIAILAADGKPAQAMRVNMEIMPGVKIKEVHPQYVLLTEGGITKRVDLPESAKGQGSLDVVNLPRTPIPMPGAAPAPVIGAQGSQGPSNPVVVNGMPSYNPQAQGQPQPNMNEQPGQNDQPQIYHPPNMDAANQQDMNQQQQQDMNQQQQQDMNQPQQQSHSANMPAEAPNTGMPGAEGQNPEMRPGFSGGPSGINTR